MWIYVTNFEINDTFRHFRMCKISQIFPLWINNSFPPNNNWVKESLKPPRLFLHRRSISLSPLPSTGLYTISSRLSQIYTTTGLSFINLALRRCPWQDGLVKEVQLGHNPLSGSDSGSPVNKMSSMWGLLDTVALRSLSNVTQFCRHRGDEGLLLERPSCLPSIQPDISLNTAKESCLCNQKQGFRELRDSWGDFKCAIVCVHPFSALFSPPKQRSVIYRYLRDLLLATILNLLILFTF